MIDLRKITRSIFPIKFGDSPSIDAFGRLRVSEVTTILDLKQIHDDLPPFYDIVEIGTGSASHSVQEARTQMTTSVTNDAVIMQTKQRANYSSGKSLQMFFTFNTFAPETNITKRVGYWTHLTLSSPWNILPDGFWLESSSGEVSVQIYKSNTNTESVSQSDFNIDKLDGTGPSKLTWDWDKNTILMVDMEWLGVGRVRWGIVDKGIIHYFHESNFSQHDTVTGVYMSSPNQPLRAEIRQDGIGSGTFNFICASVGVEGATNLVGKDGGISDNDTPLNATSSASWYVAMGLRLNASKVDTLVDLVSGTLKADTNDDFEWRVCMNPTYASTLTYNSITDYSVQYALGATANTVSAFGYILKAGYGIQQSTKDFDLETALRLGQAIDGTLDEIVLCVRPHSNQLAIHRAMNWRERS